MANQLLIAPNDVTNFRRSMPSKVPNFNVKVEESLLGSLKENLRDILFPEKLPPLKLTSRPVAVKSIWGAYDNRKTASTWSIIVHTVMIGTLIGLSIFGAKKVVESKHEQVTLIAPDISEYTPITPKQMP